MAEFAVVAQTEAPRRIMAGRRFTKRKREYETYVATLPAGKAGKLVPVGDETTRALALRISRAATRLGKPCSVWSAEGAVYFTAS